MSKKLDNVRIVTFEEDYTTNARIEAKQPPIYRKGSKHAIHQVTIAQIKEKGAKMKVATYDYKRAVELAKKEIEKQNKNRSERNN